MSISYRKGIITRQLTELLVLYGHWGMDWLYLEECVDSNWWTLRLWTRRN